jgi:hypothetical protein
MARRSGLTTETSYHFQQQIRALYAEAQQQGRGYGYVAQQLGVSREYVRKVCKNPTTRTVDPTVILHEALELKRDVYPDYGPMQIRDHLRQQYPEHELPSESKLGALFKQEGLSQLARPGTGKDTRPYWMELRPDQPGHTIQIDTLKLKDRAGTEMELLCAIDVRSHVAWVEPLPSMRYSAWALQRVFQVMGVPHTVQSDNGFGMIMPERYLLSNLMRSCFEQGVQQYKFVPIAEAKRNGAIERFHGTLRREYEQRGRHADDFPAWLNAWVWHYNTVKSHTHLGGKGQRKRPADVGTYHHLQPATPQNVRATTSDADSKHLTGTVSFVRLVDQRGCAFNTAPSMLFVLTPELYGNYVQIDMDIASGQGTITTREKHDGKWTPPRIIGRFAHCIGRKAADTHNGLMRVTLESDCIFAAQPYNEEDYAKWLRRRLRGGKPSLIAPGFELKEYEEHWQIVDTDTGEIVLSSNCINVYHEDDILQR